MPGSWGSVDQITGEETRQVVENRFDYSQQHADSYSSSAVTLLNTLLAQDFLDFGIGDILLTKLQSPISTSEIPPMPMRPTLNDITISEYGDIEEPPEASRYTSTLCDALASQLLTWIQNGGDPIPQSVQDAQLELATQRAELEYQKRRDQANDIYESLGWDRPPGARIALDQELYNELLRTQIESNDRILIASYERTQKWMEFATTAGIQIEKNLMDYLLNSSDAGVKLYVARMEKLKAIIARDTAIAEIQGKENEGLIKLYTADVENRVKSIEGVVKIFEQLVKQNVAEAEVLLNSAKANLDDKVQVYGIHKEIIKASATLYAQLAASALGSASAGMHISFSEGRSDSTSSSYNTAYTQSESATSSTSVQTSNSTSYSENHYFNETG